jgi:surface protein
MLVSPTADAEFTGYWQNLRTGRVETTAWLRGIYGASIAGTWVWQTVCEFCHGNVSIVCRRTIGDYGAMWCLLECGTVYVGGGAVNWFAWTSPWSAYVHHVVEINFTDTIIAGESLRFLFESLHNLTTITGLEYFDTTNVKDMSYMFFYASGLESLDLSEFDTTNVRYMNSMFRGASSLESLDLSGFDTTKVVNMSSMFAEASSLESLDLLGFDTTNVIDMSSMFYGASSLESLDLSGFNTTNVVRMYDMFYGASSLESLDLSGFNTTKVVYMHSMFLGAGSLESLDLSGFDTTNVSYMDFMFYGANSLRELTLGANFRFLGDTMLVSPVADTEFTGYWQNLRTGRVETAAGVMGINDSSIAGTWVWQTVCEFCHDNGIIVCRQPIGDYGAMWCLLECGTAYVGGGAVNWFGWTSPWSAYIHHVVEINFTDNIIAGESLQFLFAYLDNLTTINGLDYFDTTNVKDMSSMFFYASGLESLDLSSFNTENVTNMSYMFAGASSLETLDLSGFDTTNVVYMSSMFYGASSLESLDLSEFDTTNVVDMHAMFAGASSLKSLDLSGFDTTNVVYMSGMFYGASSLESLDLSGFDTTNVVYMSSMFNGASSLECLDLSSFNTTNVTSMFYMFWGANSLRELTLGPNFRFVGGTWTYLPNPPSNAEFTGLWQNLRTGRVETAAGLMGINDASIAGTWVWQTVCERCHDNVSIVCRQIIGDYGAMWCLLGCGTVYVGGGAINWTGWVSPWDAYKQYIVEINFTDTIIAGESLCFLFAGLLGLTTITGLDYFDTTNVKDMHGMFYGASSLESLDLSGFDTTNVVDMYAMFYGANSLESLDLSGFDTTNVRYMHFMFYAANKLDSLDLSGFNTTNVVDMSDMFQGVISLESLDLSGFDTANVVDMSSMFYGASSLRELTLGPNFRFVGNTWLVSPVADTEFTGYWQNLRTGRVETAAGLTGINDASIAGTWVWQRHAPTLTLTPAEVIITDANLISPPINVGGTALSSIEIDASGLPSNITVTEDNGVITVTAVRPAFGEAAIDAAFNVPVTRNGVSATLQVIVNLTPMDADLVLHAVTFILNGGTAEGQTADIVSQIHEDSAIGAANVPAPVRGGWIFTGWQYQGPANITGNMNAAAVAAYVVTGPAVFTAQWQHIPADDGGADGTTETDAPPIQQAVAAGEAADADGEIDPQALTEFHRAYLLGDSYGNFRPHSAMTRAEAATVFARVLALDFEHGIRGLPDGMSEFNVFSDINADDWFFYYIAWAFDAGHVLGDAGGTFRPNDSITREEFAAMLVRANGGPIEAGAIPFSDAENISPWALNYVYTAHNQALMIGDETGAFRSQDNIRRVEVATAKNRTLGRVHSRDQYEAIEVYNLHNARLFSDVSSAQWYYPIVLATTNDHYLTRCEDGIITGKNIVAR